MTVPVLSDLQIPLDAGLGKVYQSDATGVGGWEDAGAVPHIQTVGNGTDYDFNIDHGLGSRDVEVLVRESTTPWERVAVKVTLPTVDRAVLDFTGLVAPPSTNQFTVAVFKPGARGAQGDGTRRLAYAENVDTNGHPNVGSSNTQLIGMIIDVVAPQSGIIRVEGKVGYATGSSTATNVGLKLMNEARNVEYDGSFARPMANGAAVSNGPVGVTLEGLTPGTTYTFTLCGVAVGGGTATYAAPFRMAAYEVTV